MPRNPIFPLLSVLSACFLCARAEIPPGIGAQVPWLTYEAEDMSTNGEVLGPAYQPHTIETESSHQQAVRLNDRGDYVAFKAVKPGNTLVVRFNLPDAPTGGGLDSALRLRINGAIVRDVDLSSRNLWLYGVYPFSNDPSQGKPRNFYDEVQVRDLAYEAGDELRLEKFSSDGVPITIDLVDTEQIGPPVRMVPHAINARDMGARGDGITDDTEALRRGIAEAASSQRTLFVPAGNYLLTGDLEVPSGVVIRGAGMWHTTFVGSPEFYGDAARRVRFKLVGQGMELRDFAIFGALNYRNDQEPNDGIVGAVCQDAVIANIWVEHTKAGAWIYNGTNVRITGCRFRNLLADGVNLCVATTNSVIENCTARGTGDDCFAIWPAPSDQGYTDEHIVPGNNLIVNCTGQLTFLANGAAVYGGANNRVERCLFTDIGTGCGILISTTFPTVDEARGINNNFSGTTVIKDNVLQRCGGWDHGWAWRGSVQLCLHQHSISGLDIDGLTIEDSFSEGLTVVAPGAEHGQGTLSDARLTKLKIGRVGLGKEGAQGVFVRGDASGGLSLFECEPGEVHNESDTFEIAMP